ncbi:MAG: NYN domain-containing protein [Hyphomicrobiales bacterium]
MHFYESDRIGLFIDGANLYATARSLNLDIDYRKLLGLFRDSGHLVRANYYTAIMEDAEYSPIRPLVDWLDYNGYSVITKPTKEFTDAVTGRRKIKGNMDIEIAVDIMSMAGLINHVVLFSGDGDFRSLVEAVQRKGCRVTVVSTMATKPPMVADDLRRQADMFVEILELRDAIGRPGQQNKTEKAPEKDFNVAPENEVDDFDEFAEI